MGACMSDKPNLASNNKIDKFICEIEFNNVIKGNGFFANLLVPNKCEELKVLITNIKVLDKKEIEKNNIIMLHSKHLKNPLKIEINDLNKVYTNEKFNFTLIEINHTDYGLDINSFLEIDQFEPNYFNSKIYLVNYSNVKSKRNKCDIRNVNQEKIIFECKKLEIEPKIGNPIIIKIQGRQEDYKIIGIYQGINEENNFHSGLLLKEPIKLYFGKENKKENSTEIKDNNAIVIREEKENNENKNEKVIHFNETEKIFIDEIILKYQIKDDRNIRLFGDEFIAFNKDKCKILINSKEEVLCDYYDTEKIQLGEDNIFTIKLKGISKITYLNSMFSFCDTLISISSLDFNINKVTDMNNIFCGCESLEEIPDISKWDIKNITDISGLFSGCSSLKFLPDISKWNTSKLKDISNLFSECSSLKSLPDISKWDTSKVTNMTNLFKKCSSLVSLPDISKWNTINVSNINNMFCECSALKSLPNIENWNITNLINISRLFYHCSSLESVPDISKWNFSNMKHIISLFEGCSSLVSLPDISKWKLDKITTLFGLFSGCESLESLPDISKWNTKNITDMNSMFCGCKSLKTLPDISKWNTSNVTDMGSMFEGCSTLTKLPNISKWIINSSTFMSDMFEGCNPNLNIPDKFK